MGRPVTLFTGQWADMPLEELAQKASSWGYDGLELACWGGHFDVNRALEEDELREDIHRRIMRAYVEAGRRSDALAQYRHCREILIQELGVEPSQETQRLYQKAAGRTPG